MENTTQRVGGHCCSFCSRPFVNKYTLHRHLETSKKCSVLRTDATKTPAKASVTCKFCPFQSKLKTTVDRHQRTCKFTASKRVQELEALLEASQSQHGQNMEKLERLQAENTFLKGKIAGMTIKAPRSSTKSATDLTNVPPFTRARIDQFAATYTYELFIEGVPGLISLVRAMTIIDGVATYRCRDASRLKFERVNETHEWEVDMEGAFILGNLYDSLNALGVVEEYYQRLHDKSSSAKLRSDLDDLAGPVYYAILGDDSFALRKRKKVHRQVMQGLTGRVPAM